MVNALYCHDTWENTIHLEAAGDVLKSLYSSGMNDKECTQANGLPLMAV